jgi:hypothetical protein
VVSYDHWHDCRVWQEDGFDERRCTCGSGSSRVSPTMSRREGDAATPTDWKVSPFGQDDPDRDSYYVSSFEEALEELKYWREWHLGNK